MLLLTALSLWTAIKEGSHQSHNMLPCSQVHLWKSEVAYLTQEKKKTYAPLYTQQYLFSFPCFSVVWVWVFVCFFFFPMKRQIPTLLKKRFLPSKQQKNCFHGHSSFLMNWTVFLFLPLQLDNSDLWFLFLLVQSLWNNAFQTHFQNFTVFY